MGRTAQGDGRLTIAGPGGRMLTARCSRSRSVSPACGAWSERRSPRSWSCASPRPSAPTSDGGRVLVCRDPRPSGPMVQAAVTAGLLSVGCEVVDLGVCPTPTLQLAVELARGEGRGLDHRRPQSPGVERAQVRAGRRPLPQRHPGRGAPRRLPPGRRRARAVGPARDARRGAGRRSPTTWRPSPPRFDAAAIRARRLRVAVDCGNGSCSRLVPGWLADARLRGAADQRRPVAALPAAARALDRDRGPGAGDRARGPGRPRPRARRRRRAARASWTRRVGRSPRS
ncbi:MAG: hypothetical protein M0C28_36940 [Candidatus Moduliflexus flocculans]|nr:hypothetical protein [Candidatus Moduliflexus flocculans]